MDGWMDGWMDDRWIHAWMKRRVNDARLIGEWMNALMDGWVKAFSDE